MKLRRFSDAGVAAMHDWLDSVMATGAGVVPGELLSVGDYVKETDYDGELERAPFSSRYEWALHIDSQLADRQTSEIQADHGLWSWMTLVLFDQVCPIKSNGRRSVGQRARYIPTGDDFRTYYRHLLEGPWRIVRAHRDNPDRTKALLGGPLDKPGEIYEQLASHQELATSSTVVALAGALYMDPVTGARKRGAGGAGGGSPRRLAEILTQFDLTFDIYGMPVDRLLAMLPREFERFRPAG